MGNDQQHNRDGRFYVLPETLQFDERGLWRCVGGGFSRHGNLTETTVAPVTTSEAGLTVSELGQLLGVNAYLFSARFASHPQLSRRRISGRHVYLFAARTATAAGEGTTQSMSSREHDLVARFVIRLGSRTLR